MGVLARPGLPPSALDHFPRRQSAAPSPPPSPGASPRPPSPGPFLRPALSFLALPCVPLPACAQLPVRASLPPSTARRVVGTRVQGGPRGWGKREGRSGRRGALSALFWGHGGGRLAVAVGTRAAVSRRPADPTFGPVAPRGLRACTGAAGGAWWSVSGGSGRGALHPYLARLPPFPGT